MEWVVEAQWHGSQKLGRGVARSIEAEAIGLGEDLKMAVFLKEVWRRSEDRREN